MEVTIRGMVAYSHTCDREISMSYIADATFEHPGTGLLRVTGMIVLNGYTELKLQQYLQTHEGLSWHPN